MAQQRGIGAKLLIDSEQTFKTPPTSGQLATHILPFVSESLKLDRNLITSATIRASRNPQQPVRGNVNVAGDLNFELAPQYGKLLHHIFGSYTAVSGQLATPVQASGTTQHTFKIGTLPAGMIVEKQFLDLGVPKYFRYSGLKVNQFKLSAKAEGMISCSVSLIGAREVISGASFNSSPLDLGHTPFDGFSGRVLRGGDVLGVATEIDMTLDNGLTSDTYVMDGTGERYSLPEGFAKVSGTLKALFDSTELYELALNNTETTITLTFTKGVGDGTAGNESLILYIDELIFRPQAPVISGPTGLLVEMPFEGYYNDAAAGSALRCVLASPTSYYG